MKLRFLLILPWVLALLLLLPGHPGRRQLSHVGGRLLRYR